MVRDDSIFARVAAGQPGAVSDFMDRYGGLVWSLVRSRVRNAADAEDAAQDIFVQLWKSAAKFDPRAGSEATFVATIARRKLIDRFRAQGRHAPTEAFDEASIGLAHAEEPDVSASADASVAVQALAQLEPGQRSVLMMGVVEGLTHSEIARATGKPLGTVKAQLRRGLARVRALLEGEGRVRKGDGG